MKNENLSTPPRRDDRREKGMKNEMKTMRLIAAGFAALMLNVETTTGALPLPAAVKSYDLVVVEATPAGIAMAVRAAREGLQVLLVNHNQHLGGILSSGLGVWDTQYEGKRSPIYDEVRSALFEYYRTKYGKDSPQYRDALPGASGYTNGRFEPRVVEQILDELVAREKNITVLKGFVPTSVRRTGALLESATFREFKGAQIFAVRAKVFADCTYTGDLMALAGVPYRVGRESRKEYGEPHAGIAFVHPASQPPSPEAARLAALHDQLKLRKFTGWKRCCRRAPERQMARCKRAITEGF
jgi:hypothetical protein